MTASMLSVNWLTASGESVASTGCRPLNRLVTSNDGTVRSAPTTAPGASRTPGVGSCCRSM
ncbi:Uncharacterised protein [Mycobacteroides abscessus subsp. abscessus]|nr:Uncharacterised protein [Mycobacteroides abscessus subsp. abscessus]